MLQHFSVCRIQTLANKPDPSANREMSSPKINPRPARHNKRHSSWAIVSSDIYSTAHTSSSESIRIKIGSRCSLCRNISHYSEGVFDWNSCRSCTSWWSTHIQIENDDWDDKLCRRHDRATRLRYRSAAQSTSSCHCFISSSIWKKTSCIVKWFKPGPPVSALHLGVKYLFLCLIKTTRLRML